MDLNVEKLDCFIIKFFSLKFSINQCCLCNWFYKACVEVRFPFHYGSCEVKL